MRYQILTVRHAHELAPEQIYFKAESDDEYRMCVVLLSDKGKILKICGTDGGEPEDQTLYRRWKWVSEELNLALKMGYQRGTEDRVPDIG